MNSNIGRENFVEYARTYAHEYLNDGAITRLKEAMENDSIVYNYPPQEWVESVETVGHFEIFINAVKSFTQFYNDLKGKKATNFVLQFSYMDVDGQHIPVCKMHTYFYK